VLAASAQADPTPASHWRDLIRSYDKGVREKDKAALKTAEEGFAKIESVRRESDGAHVTPVAPPKGERFTRDDAHHAAQRKELAEAPAPPPGPDPTVQVKEILARAEFREAATGRSGKTALERWLEDAFKKIARWLEGIFPRLPSGDGSGLLAFAQTMRLLLYFLGGVGVLVLGYYVVRAVRESGWAGWRKKKRGESAAEDDLLAEAIEDPLREARQAEEAGEWRQAVRLIYIASLRLLRERGWLVLEANRTNWEYQRLLGKSVPEVARLLLPATRRCDRIWYGRREATAEDAAAMRACIAAIDAYSAEPNRGEP
jgi:hypothetical protein